MKAGDNNDKTVTAESNTCAFAGKGELHVQTICRSFHIVAMTARRDLMELEQMGALIRTHGGAIAKEKKTFDAQTPFAKRRKLHTEKKRQLAHIARGLLKEHDRIFLASGSTMDMFASALLHYLPLTVVTDAVNVAYELYRIVQESMNNILKYSSGTQISISLLMDGAHVRLEIFSNGVMKRSSSKGIGMRTMEDRVRCMNGTLHVAADETGVCVTVTAPFK